MPNRELTHVEVYKHILTSAVASNTSTAALDIGLPLVNQPTSGFLGSGGNVFAEAAAILVDVSTPTSLATAVTLTLTPQEADASGGPWTAIDPLYVDWSQDGIPGYLVAGTPNVWTTQIPGNVPQSGTAALVLNGASLESHVYAMSYIGGQHRFIRVNLAVAGSVLNVVSAIGVLGSLLETYGRAFSNWNPVTSGIG